MEAEFDGLIDLHELVEVASAPMSPQHGQRAAAATHALNVSLTPHRAETTSSGAEELLVCSLRAFTVSVSLVDAATGAPAPDWAPALRATLVFADTGLPVPAASGEAPLSGEVGEKQAVGGACAFRLRAQALSFHHSRRRFAVRVEVAGEQSGGGGGGCYALSPPIRSVARLPNSLPSSLPKERKGAAAARVSSKQPNAAVPPATPAADPAADPPAAPAVATAAPTAHAAPPSGRLPPARRPPAPPIVVVADGSEDDEEDDEEVAGSEAGSGGEEAAAAWFDSEARDALGTAATGARAGAAEARGGGGCIANGGPRDDDVAGVGRGRRSSSASSSGSSASTLGDVADKLRAQGDMLAAVLAQQQHILSELGLTRPQRPSGTAVTASDVWSNTATPPVVWGV